MGDYYVKKIDVDRDWYKFVILKYKGSDYFYPSIKINTSLINIYIENKKKVKREMEGLN